MSEQQNLDAVIADLLEAAYTTLEHDSNPDDPDQPERVWSQAKLTKEFGEILRRHGCLPRRSGRKRGAA